jgi:hypothetical protein
MSSTTKELIVEFAKALVTAFGAGTGEALGKRISSWINPNEPDDEDEEGEAVE